jgi:hypothetical protein
MVGLASLLLAAACSGPETGLIVELRTDMAVPDDLDEAYIYAVSAGKSEKLFAKN